MSQSKINQPKPNRRQKMSFRIIIDKEKCKGCGLCIMYCPLNCLRLSEGFNRKAARFAEFIPNSKCCGCGRCFFVCPESCIEVARDK